MNQHAQRAVQETRIVQAILVVMFLFGGALRLGWPQRATQLIVNQQGQPAMELAADSAPPIWTVVPFALVLAAIALLPFLPATQHWWESNGNKLLVSLALSAATLIYYAFLHRGTLVGAWPAHHTLQATGAGLQTGFVRAVLEDALLQEFIPFIVLLFSLFVICGGIRITGNLTADPLTNAGFLATGAVLANLIGTTGAAMLLIRPLLETNQERRHVVHTVVFFIFIVCNCGGMLLPLGPPLFLGYLAGVPFFWTLGLWKAWATIVGLLLVVYVILDRWVFYHRESVADIERDLEHVQKLRFSGWRLNASLLLGVVLAVAFLDPSKAVPGTNWHPWLYLREVAELVLVTISLHWGDRFVREQNHFNLAALTEVAALFVGIFVCMQPALQILAVHGSQLGVDTPTRAFWAAGSLSSVLDNAPTYLAFLTAAQSIPHATGTNLVAGVAPRILVGISVGSVCMGAMTYIGNGPNFMVKSMAERAGVRMPGFFGYLLYSFAILLPVFALAVWIFLT
jgi:Na+/H+ antiporter NhaD/arsenite permease-like protein